MSLLFLFKIPTYVFMFLLGICLLVSIYCSVSTYRRLLSYRRIPDRGLPAYLPLSVYRRLLYYRRIPDRGQTMVSLPASIILQAHTWPRTNLSQFTGVYYLTGAYLTEAKQWSVYRRLLSYRRIPDRGVPFSSYRRLLSYLIEAKP